ncbi:MAG: gluconeogenesis factor YvcK family protein [Candidatus Nanopelagicales bacterium]
MTVPGALLPTGTPPQSGPAVVAMGGGHGLAVTLRALRRVTDRVTAIVGVADDGGSSGRLRAGLGVPPPGDLRMALAALCGDDDWGRTWARVLQHRFAGGDVGGHALGNLLIAALWEENHDLVSSLDWVAALLGAHGRVLPVCCQGLEIVADVWDVPGYPGLSEVRGQARVAVTAGRVAGVRLEPTGPPACTDAVAAIGAADALVLGPGSWYTSVIANLLVPEIAAAVRQADARRILVLNLIPQTGETAGFSPESHLRVLMELCEGLDFDVVLADPGHAPDVESLRAACSRLHAELVLAEVSDPAQAPGHHDPDRLGRALSELLGRGRIPAWQ